MHYSYNAIFGRGSINVFEAIISHPYLCMKMPAINGVITVFGDQVEARSIEKESSPGQKNINIMVISEEDDMKEMENVKPQQKARPD